MRLVFAAAVLIAAIATPAARAEDPAAREVRTAITPESVLEELNLVRVREGREPFRKDGRLTLAAEDRIRDMIELAYWAHESPDGGSPFVWIRMRGYGYERAGENLASGFETAELLVASWMESKGHRDNILEPLFADVGIAVLEGATTGRATGKSVVVLFGRERIAPPIRPRESAGRAP
ncbi:MAG: CAP domain-containing protein [Thermoanaerobaculia bacterium]